MKFCGVSKDVEIDISADMPSFSGLGTSSTFIVGLLNTLYAYQYKRKPSIELAYEAINIERNILGEHVGCQDQVFAAVGGLNVVEFKTTRDIVVNRLVIRPDRLEEFEDCLVLVFTGAFRRASEAAKKQIENIGTNIERLQRLHKMVYDGYDVLTGNSGFEEFGVLLDKMWKEKAALEDGVSNGEIDSLYKHGIDSGALGGKLLGAGGGGFILFFVPPENRKEFNEKMKVKKLLSVQINAPGSMVVHM